MKGKTPSSNTLRLLREYLNYDPVNGIIQWTISPQLAIPAGTRAGTISLFGYRKILLKRRSYKATRIAHFLMTGQWPAPDVDVDHINGNRSDDRWVNLRLCDRSQNMINSKLRKNNKTGVRGVHTTKTGYRARIDKDGKGYYLGSFATIEEAKRAYDAAAARLHGDYRRAA
jgi:hypothetical protein